MAGHGPPDGMRRGPTVPRYTPVEWVAEQDRRWQDIERQVPDLTDTYDCMSYTNDWVMRHYGNYQNHVELTCRNEYPRLKQWEVNPFATNPVKDMKARGMVSAAECSEPYFRECIARCWDTPHEYAKRLMAAARIQQVICKYSYVTELAACIKFLSNLPHIKEGLAVRTFHLLQSDFGMRRPMDLYMLADYAQRAYIELEAESKDPYESDCEPICMHVSSCVNLHQCAHLQ